MSYNHPSQRIDKPPKYPSDHWKFQNSKYPGPVSAMKTYYNPFFINKPSVLGYSPINTMSNQAAYSTLHRNSIPSSGSNRGKYISGANRLSKDGKACLLKAICEVSQVAQRKGTFMEEIIKVIFRY
ncbi:hypothetical protein NQ314_002967, partial [Rhamnusium bicolor]